jgi:hypothetical protein
MTKELLVKDVKDISRQTLVNNYDSIKFQRGDVVIEAASKLGYQGLSVNAEGPLEKVLRLKEIEVLDPSQVKVYKMSKVSNINLTEKKRRDIGISIISAVFISVYSICVHISNESLLSTYLASIIPALVISMWTFIMGSLAFNPSTTTWKNTSWVEIRLSEYQNYIPVHVLNKCLAIREECPNAQFIVHELQERIHHVSASLLDPFMEVRLYNESFFIEVWDEREFEAKM